MSESQFGVGDHLSANNFWRLLVPLTIETLKCGGTPFSGDF
jgi:hypothetical protein